MASKITDHDLLLQELFLEDTYAQSGLVFDLQDGEGLLEILNRYAYGEYPAKKATCVECGSARHKRGYTVLTTRMRKTLVGNCCGRAVFGESWTQAERRLKQREDRKHELERLRRLGVIVAPLRQAIERWRRPFSEMVARRRGFIGNHGELSSRIQEASLRHGGMLRLDLKQTIPQARPGERQFTYVEVDFGILPGAKALDEFDLGVAVDQLLDAIGMIEMTLQRGTGAVDHALLARNRHRFERALDGLDRAVEAYQDGQEFFRSETFKLLADWSSRRNDRNHRYVWTGDGLEDEYTGRRVTLLAHLRDLDDEAIRLIKEYRRSD